MARSIAVALAVLAAATQGGASPRCTGGRFEVRGAPLLGTGPAASDAVIVTTTDLSIASGCAARARRATSERARRVTGHWPACEAASGRVRLSGRIDRRCTKLSGTLHTGTGRHRTARRFVADRVEPTAAGIIPRPAAAWQPLTGGAFRFESSTALLAEAGRPDVREVASALAALLAPQALATGGVVDTTASEPPPNAVLLTTAGADPGLGDEGYDLRIERDRVIIRAPAPAGLFYGVQSLRQLLPPAVEHPDTTGSVAWTIPILHLADTPRFRWRGLMLDVSRAFFPKAFLLRYLDLLALHKMNVLHLHLTDDQGWRVEIPAYPQLHLLGSTFDPVQFPNERGGYLTRNDLREIVAYAARRHVEVIPEIDVPGHSVAALHAMPELACTTAPDVVRTASDFPIVPWWNPPDGVLVHEEILCACDPHVYEVLAAILDEVTQIFPSRWVHVGGDEVPTAEWASAWRCPALVAAEGLGGVDHVQAYFTHRVEALLAARGKVLLAWDEAYAAQESVPAQTLSPSAAFMHWRDFAPTPPGLFAHDVVQTPFSRLYLDYKAVGIEPVYGYDPTAGLSPDQAAHVLGAQGNMWTGFPPARNETGIDTHVFPRLLAIAEMTWTPQALRDFADFETRRPRLTERLDLLGVAR